MIYLKLIGITGILLVILHTSAVDGSTSTQNRCDQTKSEKINTGCIGCRENINANCPTGFRKTTRGKGRRGCRYRIQAGSRTRPAVGCFHTCIRVIQKVECCGGFWGRDCQACPSSSGGEVCSGRGVCSDLMAGNGTCMCRGRIGGSTCEKCQEENHYGPNCESTCGCVHGRCDSGVGRPGTCLCDSGYGGALCDHVLAACATRNCPANSRCLSNEGTLQCLCNPGYEGVTCQPINPCDDSDTLCSPNASCSHTGPAKYLCTCNTGYTGDGKWCGAIDPCQTNNGGCPSNTTTCRYTGPGQFVCDCNLGYENLTNSGCSVIDQCGVFDNSTCDSRANCTTIDDNGSIRVSCQCPIGFLNKGLNCHSDLFTEMQLVNESGIFQNQLNTAIKMFMNTYFQDLFFSTTPFTLLLPQDEAFGSELGEPDSSEMWKARARAHIIASEIVIDFQSESAKSMYPLLGSRYSIKALRPITPDPNPDDDSAGVFAQINFANSFRTGGIVASNFWAANGVFYVIDTVLEPPEVFQNSGYDAVSSMPLLPVLKLTPDATNFLKLWKRNDQMWRWVQDPGMDFTFLIPSNDAVDSLTDDERKALEDWENREKLTALLRHHMVLRRINSTTLAGVRDLETANTAVVVNVSESNGMMTIGNAKVLVSDIAVTRIINFYIIDKVIIPDNIKPLVNNWCTRTRSVTKQGPCEPCSPTLTCPDGGVYQTRKICVREVETISGSASISNKYGCRALCNVNVSTSICCIGYFGPNCLSCPGPVGNQCGGNGQCDDGMNGVGRCSCSPCFTGSDCSICTSPNMYGDGCYTNCSCVHGVCNNRAVSRGICEAGSCEDGWAGENCDRQVVPCGRQGLICHQHAVCLETDTQESCVCEPGYTGDGTACIEFNPCTDSNDRGGCSINGICYYYGKGNTSCKCKDHFEGDGYHCSVVNPCTKPNRGNCHEKAYCRLTEPGLNSCTCIDGYRGNGQVCTEIDNCLQNNGGCHGRATCTKDGPGSNICECLTGYSGDGLQCVGTLSMEITEHPELNLIQHWAETMPSVQTLFNSISSYQVTVFLPRNEAWHSMQPGDYQFWITEQHLPDLLRHHIVVGQQGGIPSYKLKQNSKLETLLPTTTITVTNQTSGVQEQDVGSNVTRNEMIPTLGSKFAKIIIPDLRIFNGVVHVIEYVLLPPRDAIHDHPSLAQVVKNSTGTDLAMFSVFLNSLNSSGVISEIIDSNDSYTIFALSNDIFDPLSVSDNKDIVMRYHVIVGKLIRVDDVQSGQHESTLAGAGYQVTLTSMHGRMYVNGKQTTRTGVRTAKGIIHGFSDSPLTPIKSRCDKTTTNVFRTPCLPCMLNFPCPDESPSSMVAQVHCYFRGFGFTGDARSRVGCRKLCRLKVKSKACCGGFYGNDCEPCPGGIGNTCFKQGTCSDGIAGNGTCSCTDSKFSGLACDDCAPGLFGEDCGSNCACVNGSCDHGKKGSGKCFCQKGFTGTTCNQAIVATNACNNTCDSSAVCSGSHAISKCVCANGYTGDGTQCTPINPCRDANFDRCHAYASCVYRGAGQYDCKCKDGFQGDGTYCFEINPCLGNATDCNVERGLCHHTGPNQYNCVCKEGYSGDGKTCSPVDPCATDNGGCHPFAKCTKEGPGSRSCSCYANYVGDGITRCIGSVYQEYLNDAQISWFLQGSMVRSTLDTSGLITVFLPYIPGNQTQQYPRTDTQFFLNHVVGCGSFNLTDLQKAGQVTSMVGNPLNITTRNGQVFLNGNIGLEPPRILANGVAYRINRIIPTSTSVGSTSGSDVTSNVMLLKNMGFNKFAALMNTASMIDVLSQEVHGRWTMFVPTDDAFARLSSYNLRQVVNDNDTAAEYAKYHLVRQSFMTPADAMKTQELTTMQGSDVTIACSSSNIGRFVLNGGESTVTRFVAKKLFSSGRTPLSSALYVIDKVLLPPSVGGRCDVNRDVTSYSACSFCHSVMGCPTGTANIGVKRNVMCKSRDGSGSVTMFVGCQSICTTYHVIKNCCDDFYGRDCHPCPGGIDNACSHNGICDAGINGTGTCKCDVGFTGHACELCKIGRYGFNCEPCKCSVKGKCMEGMNGDGRCFCDQGYTGEFCDKKLVHPSNCSVPCVANAVCVEGGVCVCRPGYRGIGTDMCEVPNLCQERPNGGCSRHATCTPGTLSVECICKPNYVGDGFVCEGSDPCNDEANPPNCHNFARCVYVGPGQTRCDCLPGYKGDGVNQCEVDSEWTNQGPRICAVNNGGCSSDAVCADLATSALEQTRKVNCTCKKGFVGDGLTCNGNIFQVLSQADYQMGKFYQKIIRSGNLKLMFKLRNHPNLTLFVPVDSALTFRKLRYKTLKRHIVTGHSYTTVDLQSLPAVLSDSKTPLPVQSIPRGLFISGVKVRKPDIIATNGVIHTIEGVLPGKPQTISTSTSTVASPAVSPSNTDNPGKVTKSPKTSASTTKKSTIDGGGIPKNSSQPPGNTTTMKLTPKVTQKPPSPRSSSNGVKVGVAVGIVLLVLIVVIVVYWKKRSAMFVFRPLSERARLTSRSEDAFDDPVPGFGMMNPAYDSTAFSDMPSGAPADEEINISSPLEAEEMAEEEALIGFNDITD
uniref:Stabilin-2 n=1 Tax=Phallusia mammillata TaxID=59560 RepID=A0A6F9DUE0_9ASCI|nr:stabilin-2 [Phallusia mammillata]